MILRNLRRNLRRSLLMGVTIASAYAGLLLMFGYIDRIDKYLMVNSVYINHSGHLRIYREGGLENFYQRPQKYLLSQNDIRRLEALIPQKLSSFEKMSPFLEGMGLVSNACKYQPFRLKAMPPDHERWMRKHPLVHQWTPELLSLKKGESFSIGKTESAILMTAGLAELLGKPAVLGTSQGFAAAEVDDCGNPETQSWIRQSPEVQLIAQTFDGGMNASDALISGHFSTGLFLSEDSGIQVPLEMARNLYSTDGATYLGVFLRDSDQVPSAERTLRTIFAREGLPFEVHPYSDERIGLFYTGTMNFLFSMSAFFFFLITLVIIIAIANSVSMTIFERIRELGTMRALGYSSSQISWMMGNETVVLTLFGLAGGFIFSHFAALLVNYANLRFRPPGIADDMQFMVTLFPGRAFQILVPLVLISFLTSYVVTRRKMKDKISHLLVQ